MTASMQRAFNKAYLGLQGQDFRKSEDDEEKCMYRGPNGLRCAAGWLLPDSKYRAAFEGKSIDGLPPAIFGGVSYALLLALQSAHDDCSDAADMKRRLVLVAEKYDLIIPA